MFPDCAGGVTLWLPVFLFPDKITKFCYFSKKTKGDKDNEKTRNQNKNCRL